MNLLKTGIAAVAAISIGTGMSASDSRPMQLKYDRPAQYFEEALILGNGNLGASVYGGVEHEKSHSTTSPYGPANRIWK